MSRDPHDILIDQLLREILGGDRPRDMTARVIGQAKIIDRFRRRRWVGIGSAIAASIALIAGAYFYWPHEYPNPSADDQVAVVDNMPIQRGASLYTEGAIGNVKLGGYVDINMSPQTALNLGGGKYQEKVLLNQGELDVDVTKHKGQFDIAVGPATVHVTGTRFRVRIGEENTPTAWTKVLHVAVKEGSVEVQGLPNNAKTETVTTGQERDFPLQVISKATGSASLAGAQAGARIGARGGQGNLPARVPPAITPTPVITPPVTPLPPLKPSTTGTTGGGPNRPVQLLTTPTAANRVGQVLHTGNIFYLENGEGDFFMFEKATVYIAHPDWVTLSGDQKMRVVWGEGLVTRIEKLPPNNVSTTQPK